jgi:hypothetical protein
MARATNSSARGAVFHELERTADHSKSAPGPQNRSGTAPIWRRPHGFARRRSPRVLSTERADLSRTDTEVIDTDKPKLSARQTEFFARVPI